MIKKHKLLTFLILLLFIPVINTLYVRYENWDNSQMIKGLAKDFPQLVQDIEKATGLDLEIKSDCSTTTEKFSSGVKSCELSIAKSADELQLKKYRDVLESNDNFRKASIFSNNEGYHYIYRKKNSCEFRYIGTVFGSCITAVKDANKNLAIEEFSRATSGN